MKEYTTEFIRNVALASHGSSGKTMLVEAFAHFTGITTRLGGIQEGNTLADFEEEEIRRGLSLSTAIIPIEYKDCKINFLDTPGYTDFVGEMVSGLRVADGVLVVVDAVAGAEVGTEVALHYSDQFSLARFVIIDKMDRDNANFRKAMDSVQQLSEKRLIPVQLPWVGEKGFQGVIDLRTMKAYRGNGKQADDISGDLSDEVEAARMELIEAAAEGEDALLEKYLEGEELSTEEITRGLRQIIQSSTYIPVFVAAGGAEIGIASLLDAIIDLLPLPNHKPVKAVGVSGEEELIVTDAGPLAAYVWKTTADPFVGKITYFRVYSGVVSADTRVWNQNKSIEERFGTVSLMRGKELIQIKNIHAGDIGTVPKLSGTATGDTFCDRGHPLTLPIPGYPHALYRVAITPKTQGDAGKLSPTMTRLCEEDKTLSWYMESSTNQAILQGMGDQHIDVAIRKAESKFSTNLLIEEPKVPYNETITRSALAQYRHKKQSGGAGQFGEVHMRLEPLSEENYEFVNEVFGGSISSNFMPAIEKGVRNVMKAGVIAGYPVVKVKVAVVDGKEHPVDSKPVAFEIAARECFKLAFKDANPVLLEPIMNLKITVPEENMGDVLGNLSTKRAKVQGMDTEHGRSVITAQVPLAEIQRYTTELRSMTGGRGVFTMELDHYETVPSHIAQNVIEARQKELESRKED
ncbi:MAG: elongation factor G [Anaerolineales bacterium]|nr:elongation factor G [Anaerolineales bacterium]